jgi:probable addiction module antidote protein
MQSVTEIKAIWSLFACIDHIYGQSYIFGPAQQCFLEILQGAAKMTLGTRSHEDSVLEMLRDDEAFALEYLSVALEEIDEAGGEDAFLVAIRRVAEARGGMLSLSQNTGLNRANLYRSIAVGGDPKLSTLLKVLQALGVGMSKVIAHRAEQDVRA